MSRRGSKNNGLKHVGLNRAKMWFRNRYIQVSECIVSRRNKWASTNVVEFTGTDSTGTGNGFASPRSRPTNASHSKWKRHIELHSRKVRLGYGNGMLHPPCED